MSSARRRRRRSRGQATGGATEQQPQARGAGAQWNWRTFPVYFGFSLGMFIGLYMGLIAGELSREGNTWMSTGIFIAVAIMLGLGLSRLTTNWLVNRRFIKARERKASR
jgi:hypothetical protein